MEFSDRTDRTTAVVLVTSGVLLAAYMNYGTAIFAAGVIDLPPRSPDAVLWQFLSAFALFFAVPALIWRAGLRLRLAEAGFGAGDWRFGLKFLLFAVPLLLVPMVWLGSRMPGIKGEYPLARGPTGEPVFLGVIEAAYLLYYLGWEFFFRGWLLLGLRDRLGDVGAVGFSMLVSTAVHMGKPEGEIWGAVLAGLVFGWLAIRTRSILWPFVLHALAGVLTDVLVVAGTSP